MVHTAERTPEFIILFISLAIRKHLFRARHRQAPGGKGAILPAADSLVGAGNQPHLTADLHLNRTEWARMEKINLVLL